MTDRRYSLLSTQTTPPRYSLLETVGTRTTTIATALDQETGEHICGLLNRHETEQLAELEARLFGATSEGELG
jgi:hypothetical protein